LILSYSSTCLPLLTNANRLTMDGWKRRGNKLCDYGVHAGHDCNDLICLHILNISEMRFSRLRFIHNKVLNSVTGHHLTYIYYFLRKYDFRRQASHSNSSIQLFDILSWIVASPFEYFARRYRRLQLGCQILLLENKRCICIFELFFVEFSWDAR
jgi:hypothetical protein